MRSVIIATAGGMHSTDGFRLIGGRSVRGDFVLSLHHLQAAPYGCTEPSVTLETQRSLLVSADF